jgi:hypothetical protein
MVVAWLRSYYDPLTFCCVNRDHFLRESSTQKWLFGTNWRITFCIGQRLIALYLSRKRLAAKEIHQELGEMLRLDIVIYSMIPWYLCKTRVDGRNQAEAERMSARHFGGAIVKVLADSPFSSMRESSTLTCFSRYAVHRSLTKLIDSTVHSLQCIPIVCQTIRRPSGRTCFESYCQRFRKSKPATGTTL